VVAPAVASPDRELDRRRLGWAGLGVALLSILCGLLAASLLGAVYSSVRDLNQAEAERDLGFAMVTAVGLWVGFLVLPVVWSRRHGGPDRYLGLSAQWIDLPVGVAVGLASTAVAGIVSSVVLSAAERKALESTADTLVDRARGPAAAALLVVTLCVVTPLAEELFFRGLIFRSLHRVAGGGAGLVIAVLAGGLVFGLVHYDGKPASGVVVAVQLGLLGLFGAVLCTLTYRTGRLGAAIVAHGVFNAVTVLSLLSRR